MHFLCEWPNSDGLMWFLRKNVMKSYERLKVPVQSIWWRVYNLNITCANFKAYAVIFERIVFSDTENL